VLAVDDERDTLELVRVILARAGAVVTTATDAAAALDALRRTRPDVLLTDIGMPVEDGYQLLRRVRALGADEGGQTPAVALTAYAGEADRSRTLAAGFQLHLPKPVDAAQLVAVIANLVGASERV
jgi:CheY-like chemotaxis protein